MITVMLPTYNEEANLGPLLFKLQSVMENLGAPYRVLVVDDGSDDGTVEIVERFLSEMPLEVVRHSRNLGLAQALRTGLRVAVSHADPDDVLITMDADNTHDPHHIPAMLSRLAEGYDVVIASRYQPGGEEIGLSAERWFLSRSVNLLLRACFASKGVRDYTCGYRAYRSGIVQRAWEVFGDRFIEANTFAAMAEILLKLHAIGMRASEVPLVLRYDLKGGRSKMQVGRTIRNYTSVIWRVWWLKHSSLARNERRKALAQQNFGRTIVRGWEE